VNGNLHERCRRRADHAPSFLQSLAVGFGASLLWRIGRREVGQPAAAAPRAFRRPWSSTR